MATVTLPIQTNLAQLEEKTKLIAKKFAELQALLTELSEMGVEIKVAENDEV